MTTTLNEAPAAPSRVLLVEDDEALLRVTARRLASAGFAVTTASHGEDAIAAVRREPFDVIASDVRMPKMDGIAFLRAVREHDLDVPVVLMTGGPSVETAAKAMEYGALRYLIKPVEAEVLVSAVRDAARLHRLARLKRDALALLGDADRLVGDRAGLEACFGRALASLWIAYQPIVRWSSRSVHAYEALLRSTEPALPHPGAVLDAAERLGRVHELGRVCRARAAEPYAPRASQCELFVNLHPRDLLDEALYDAAAPLAAHAPRVVLEVTERASLAAVPDLAGRVAALRRLGYRVAIDDLGAGYAGLTTFAQLEPEVAKIDMSLVRGIDQSTTKRKLVRGMVALCRDLGIDVVAEGVETTAERDVLLAEGVDLLQGYLFARPDRPFPSPAL